MDGEKKGHPERVKREGSLFPLLAVLPQCVLFLPLSKPTS